MKYLNKENLESVFSYAPIYDGDQEVDKLPFLLKKLEVGDDNIVATFKRKERTRKLRVLAFEEWTDGKFLRCVADFSHENNKRKYSARPSRNSIDDIVFIYGTLSDLYPEGEDFQVEIINNDATWASTSYID